MISRFKDYDLYNNNTFRLHCVAKCFITIDNPTSDLPELYNSGELSDSPLLVLGGGSNMLFTGSHYNGTVLHISPTTKWDVNSGNRYSVSAGMKLDYLVSKATEASLWGIENLRSIPGTVGGATVQNAGAYGVEFGELIQQVEYFNLRTGKFATLTHDECRFAYRNSIFKTPEMAGSCIITTVTLTLSSTPNPRLKYAALASAVDSNPSPTDISSAVDKIRSSKLPDVNTYPSAGSFFRNPVVDINTFNRIKKLCGAEPSHFTLENGMVKLSAAWLIDKAGLKGITCGGAGVWPKQPLVLVNLNSATADDIIRLEKDIIDNVYRRFGVTLSPEVEHIS